MEMAVPATKFWYRRLLSLLGIKADFKRPVSSNTLYDICSTNNEMNITDDSIQYLNLNETEIKFAHLQEDILL